MSAANAGPIAASLRKYGYAGPSDGDALARWLRAQGPHIDTEVVARTTAPGREPRPDQRRFRRALLEAYGGRCALTGCDVADALEAAHVADWRSENDPGAGILLRADLHRLHERGLLVIDGDYTVRSSPAWYRALAGTNGCGSRPTGCTGHASEAGRAGPAQAAERDRERSTPLA